MGPLVTIRNFKMCMYIDFRPYDLESVEICGRHTMPNTNGAYYFKMTNKRQIDFSIIFV